MIHRTQLRAKWQGGLRGSGVLESEGFETHYSAAKDLGGSGVGANPEEILLAASGGCLLITLAAVLERSGIEFERLDIESEMELLVDKGMTVKTIRHFPRVSGATAPIDEALKRAEEFCLVSKAMKGNVAIEVVRR